MLTFPTQAEQCLVAWRKSPTTTALSTVAKRRGADVEKDGETITYIFDDDTSLTTTGRGAHHTVETHFP